MKRAALAIAAALIALAASAPPAEARGGIHIGVGVGLGVGCCLAAPWWGWPLYVPPVYYYPPPAYYPPPVGYAPAPQALNADPASPVYVDGFGRSCREYQSVAMIGGAARQIRGVACLGRDGVWRVVR